MLPSCDCIVSPSLPIKLPVFNTTAKRQWISALLVILSALVCLPWLDIEFANTLPWTEVQAMLAGLLAPQFVIAGLWTAVAHTIAFALQAVAIAAALGFVLSQCYRLPGIAPVMALLRSVHELFWALIILQIFGLSALTGLLALAIPYSATFARVYAEIFEETSRKPYQSLPGSHLSRFLFSTLPQAWPHLCSYFRYRLECALRASVVLGFVGLPTLGFLLESYVKMGIYPEVMAILILIVALVLTLKWWSKAIIFWPLLLLSFIYLPPLPAVDFQMTLLLQLVQDSIPTSLAAGHWHQFGGWLSMLWQQQIAQGLAYTLLLSQLALVLSMLVALVAFPLVSSVFINSAAARVPGHIILVVLRSLPEMLLAFLGLIFFGPSLLPGILAIGLHNGAILAHLMGRYSNEITLRVDVSNIGIRSVLGRYFYELLPRLYAQFLAFTLYRWEVMMRETAILGMIGIPTLGFFIDSAFEEFRLDRALLLIVVSAALNILAEFLARRLRQGLHSDRAVNYCR